MKNNLLGRILLWLGVLGPFVSIVLYEFSPPYISMGPVPAPTPFLAVLSWYVLIASFVLFLAGWWVNRKGSLPDTILKVIGAIIYLLIFGIFLVLAHGTGGVELISS